MNRILSKDRIHLSRSFRFPKWLSSVKTRTISKALSVNPDQRTKETYSFLVTQPRNDSSLCPSRLNLKQEIVRRKEDDDSFRSDRRDIDDRASQLVKLHRYIPSERVRPLDTGGRTVAKDREAYKFLIFPLGVRKLERDSFRSSRYCESCNVILRYYVSARESREPFEREVWEQLFSEITHLLSRCEEVSRRQMGRSRWKRYEKLD